MRTDNKYKASPSVPWDVILKGKIVDTVWHRTHCDGGAPITAQGARDSLVNHDGYNPAIVVRRAK